MNVHDIIELTNKPTARNKELVKKLTKNVHKKIKEYAKLHKDSCSYIIPSIIDGMPVYNIDFIAKEIFTTLDSEGFIVEAYPDGKINVYWNKDLIEQKAKTDLFLIKEREREISLLNKKTKLIDQRYSVFANEAKLKPKDELEPEDELDRQLKKVLKEREKEQRKYRNIIKGI